MNQTRIFVFLSILGLLLAFGLVLKKKIPQDEWDLLISEGKIPQTLIPAPRLAHSRRSVDADLDDSLDNGEPVVELKDVSDDVKTWDDLLSHTAGIPRLDSIPWEVSEIEAALKRFRSGTCQLLVPGTDVFPLPLEIGDIATPIMSFRQGAAVVGLKMDPIAQRRLPKISKGEIEGYLDNHMLTLQVTVYRNQSGEVSFAGPVTAAFVSKKSPRETIAPEKMIREAVGRIRLLGVLNESPQKSTELVPAPENAEQSERTDKLAARTLVLSFAYERDIGGTGGKGLTTTDYELLFLHLVQDESAVFAEPTLVAFATTEGRKNFVALKPTETKPNIHASIRFEEFTMMGLYPASPVVTDVKCAASYTAPVEEIRHRLRSDSGLPPITVTQLLDEIHQSTSTPGVRRRF